MPKPRDRTQIVLAMAKARLERQRVKAVERERAPVARVLQMRKLKR